MRGRWAGSLALLATAGCVAPPVGRPVEPSRPIAGPSAPGCDPSIAECGGAPSIPATLASTIATAPSLSRFRTLAATGELSAILARIGPATVIAPTDAAFARLAPGVFEALLLPGNRPSLRHLLRYWIVPGPLTRDALATRAGAATGAAVPTLEGEPLRLVGSAGGAIALVDAYRRSASIVGETQAADGDLLLVDGIVAPRSIEPDRTSPTG